MQEILPLVDENGNVIGKAAREDCHFSEDIKLLHPVVHLHLFNPAGDVFLQLRPEHKKVQPGKWDTAVGGHISYGETILDALKRESLEEIGIDPSGAKLNTTYIWETNIERELVYVFVLHAQKSPEINKNELADGKFWKKDELIDSMGNKVFTPNLEKEIKMLML